MAVEHVTAVLHGMFDVDPSAKLVMLILAEHARRGSALAWPSMETLARLSCLQRRQVHAIVHYLVECGWLELERSKGGFGRTNVYRLNMEALKEARNDAARRTVSGSTNGAADCMVTMGQTVQSLVPNSAVGNTKLCSPPPTTVQPAAQEPVLTLINSTGTALEPESAPISTTALSTELSTQPLKILKSEPERRRSKGNGSGEPSEQELERRKRAQLKQLAEYAKSKAVRQ